MSAQSYLDKKGGDLLWSVVVTRDAMDHTDRIYEPRNSFYHGHLYKDAPRTQLISQGVKKLFIIKSLKTRYCITHINTSLVGTFFLCFFNNALCLNLFSLSKKKNNTPHKITINKTNNFNTWSFLPVDVQNILLALLTAELIWILLIFLVDFLLVQNKIYDTSFKKTSQ